ncbi:MAG: helix-turn-helix transcriptional regulator [Clostridia bacterium]|nr:helix-turn-helix transcriptional regulator [Clostridia bacterium]
MYGKILKDLRQEKGLTQAQLAQDLETTQRNISRYELETIDLSTEMVSKICKYFKISADYLLGIKGD